MPSITDDVERWVLVGTASLSIIGCLLIIFVIMLYAKYRWHAQRFILSLSIASLLNPIIDLYPQPPFRSWTEASYCGFGVLSLGSRYALLLADMGILLVSIYALRTGKEWSKVSETFFHTVTWIFGCGVGTFFLIECDISLRNYVGDVTDDSRLKTVLNWLTYVWLGGVSFQVLLCAILFLEERRIKSNLRRQYDPDNDTSRQQRLFRIR